MKLPDGQVVTPAYQNLLSDRKVEQYPLHPFPAGLELLAGDHHGSAPSSRITFLCANGKGYSNKAGEVCGLRKGGDAVQFNIGIQFPNCWDGSTSNRLTDTVTRHTTSTAPVRATIR
jgi:hypothetical protein